jgi:hypothetical protein
MKCPFCNNSVTLKGNSPNGGILCVAEYFDNSTETYDDDIVEYICNVDPKHHTFYAFNIAKIRKLK